MATNLPLAMNMPVTMTSLQIAELTGKEHFHVMRDIDVMTKALSISVGDGIDASISGGIYKDTQNRKQELYNLNYELTLTLVTGYSVELRHTVVKRWMELEKERLAAIDQEKSRVYHRELARLQCPEMTAALEHDRSQRGKETQWYHYATEFDMINRIVLGVTAKKFRINHGLGEKTLIRDYMPAHQVESIQRLRQYNATMMELGFSYEERKAKLEQKHNQGLLK